MPTGNFLALQLCFYPTVIKYNLLLRPNVTWCDHLPQIPVLNSVSMHSIAVPTTCACEARRLRMSQTVTIVWSEPQDWDWALRLGDSLTKTETWKRLIKLEEVCVVRCRHVGSIFWKICWLSVGTKCWLNWKLTEKLYAWCSDFKSMKSSNNWHDHQIQIWSQDDQVTSFSWTTLFGWSDHGRRVSSYKADSCTSRYGLQIRAPISTTLIRRTRT